MIMLKQQLREIKAGCVELVSKHIHDVVVESQLDETFYRNLDQLADISSISDFGDIQANGYRSALDCIKCLIKVSIKHND